jgi:HAD superfamily hydrolase (TIGR01549 family)
MAHIEWLFFDVGNVLMDESAWLARYQELIFAALLEVVPGLTRERLEEERWRSGVRKDVTSVQHILSVFLSDPAARAAARRRYWDQAVQAYYDLGVPAEGVFKALDALKPRYRLGVIANQHLAIHDWMERHGLAPYFPVALYDCDIGFGKPDLRLFLRALEQAGCPPERAVMIGDRLDNDIRPAKAVGMRTIHVRAFGDHARRDPSNDAETPDASIHRLRELPHAVEELYRERRQGIDRTG